jgi:small subunit ribosomal protein S16
MVKLRLQRVGSRNKPSYRVVAADIRAPRDGAFLEILGHYNPRTEPATVVIDTEKAQKWLDCGARPSDAVARLLSHLGIEGYFTPKQNAPKQRVEPEEAS